MNRFLHFPEILTMTGVSESTIRRWMKEGAFPAARRVGPRLNVWLESDVDQWMTGLPKSDPDDVPPPPSPPKTRARR